MQKSFIQWVKKKYILTNILQYDKILDDYRIFTTKHEHSKRIISKDKFHNNNKIAIVK